MSAQLVIWTTRPATLRERYTVGLDRDADVTACLNHKRELIGIADGTRPLWRAPGVDADALERTLHRRLVGWPQPEPRPELLVHNIAREMLDGLTHKGVPRIGSPRWISDGCKLNPRGHSPRNVRAELEYLATGKQTGTSLCRALIHYLGQIADARAER